MSEQDQAPGAPQADQPGRVRRFLRAHPGVVDVLLIVLYVASVWLAAADPYEPLDTVPAVLVGACGAVAVGARRRFPLAAVVVMAALAAIAVAWDDQPGGTELGLAFTLYATAVRHTARTAWLAAAASVGVATGAVWWFQDSTLEQIVTDDGVSVALVDDRVSSAFGIVALSLAGLLIGLSVSQRRQRIEDLTARTEALMRERVRQEQLARSEERALIAREMHDVVAHSVSVMVRLADGAAAALERDPARARTALDEAARTGRAALGDMRHVLGALADGNAPMEPTAQERGLVELVDRFRAAGLPVRATGLEEPMPEDTGLRLAVYRVVQESLTNVLRHAPGTDTAHLSISRSDGVWVVEVRDDGSDERDHTTEGAGMGLVGMRERIALLGGTVEAGPHGRGWRVRVEVPEAGGGA